MDLNQILTTRYIAELEAAPPAFLSMLKAYRTGSEKGLNDVFFPTAPDGFETAPLKVMVMGRETTLWNYGEGRTFQTVADYVNVGMTKHGDFLRRFLNAPASSSGLVRLLKGAGEATSNAGLIWSNLFAVAHDAADPRKNAAAWPHVRDLSKALLDIQIDVLQPDVIIFANGIDSAGVRREFFPHAGPDGPVAGDRCTGTRNWEADKISKRHLWGFQMDGRIKCFRTQHPSAKFHRAKAAAARQILMGELRKLHASRVQGLGNYRHEQPFQ
jgi:hypothetical protein